MTPRKLRLWHLLTLTTALGACAGTDTTQQAQDDKEDTFFVGGKADNATGCSVQGILEWVNAQDTASLYDAGLHRRASNNVGEALGKAAIGSMQQLDDVPYVGPAALRQIVQAVEDAGLCDEPQVVQAEAIFSPQPIDTSHLARAVELIEGAQRSVDIAMYSFGYGPLNTALKQAIRRGVKVRMIFESANKDRANPSNSKSGALEKIGVDVRYVNKIMHHKFVLIDGPRDELESAKTGTLMSGSGNWSTSAAVRYDENAVVVTGSEELNLRYQQEFNHLWHNARDFVAGTPKTFDPGGIAITDDMLDTQDDVHAVFTSANFRTYTSSRYGRTFTRVRGMDTVSDEIVARIEDATFSIKIASGHMRSRPIAEALLKKRAEDPSVEIQVYLDGQEYISRWYEGEQERKTQVCLDEAGTSEAKKEDCLDRGAYYGLALHDAGIDVRYKYYSYRWHYRTAEQMHHKVLLIDGDTLIQGSYNLSSNAEHNTMENMAVFSGGAWSPLTQAFNDNFDTMWETGRADNLYAGLTATIEQATASIPIVFESMSLTWDEIHALKGLIADTCPAIHSAEYRENPDKKFSCRF